MTSAADSASRNAERRRPYEMSGHFGLWLTVTAGAYALLHHIGSLPDGLGHPPGSATRWVDWLDLLVPYLVLMPALAALTTAGAAVSRTMWLLFAVGAVAYASGHGIHLAANSVVNAVADSVGPTPAAVADTAHLWDERVGHLVWYAGAALVMAALALVLLQRPPVRAWWPYALALAVGVTWATNAVGGGIALLGFGAAVTFVAVGWKQRATQGRLLAVAFAPAVVLIPLLYALS